MGPTPDFCAVKGGWKLERPACSKQAFLLLSNLPMLKASKQPPKSTSKLRLLVLKGGHLPVCWTNVGFTRPFIFVSHSVIVAKPQ